VSSFAPHVDDRCSQDDCSGAAIARFRCVEHLAYGELVDALAQTPEGPLDVRDTVISANGLQRLLRAHSIAGARPVLPAVNFSGVEFSARADFAGVTFNDAASFRGARFRGEACFEGALFRKNADLTSAAFDRYGKLGPFVVMEHLVLDDALFAERITIEVAAAAVSARGAKFAGGVLLRVGHAELGLDDVDFARASTVSGVGWADTNHVFLSAFHALEADRGWLGIVRHQPRLITLRGSQVAALSLSDVDLHAARYLGAHGLEALSVEASCSWPNGPSGRHHVGRETVAEEHFWRMSTRRYHWTWRSKTAAVPAWLNNRDGPTVLAADQIASVYRALRKAREDDKDEAGASDLYYGEMEMRRHCARTRSDRAILSLYWALSGYGLKSARALATLAALIVLFSFGLQSWGFTSDPPFMRALLYSVESTSSLFRTPESGGWKITYAGEAMQIALRVLGPILLGLVFLAVRARVKR